MTLVVSSWLDQRALYRLMGQFTDEFVQTATIKSLPVFVRLAPYDVLGV
ncbi:hypothetical protein [Alicyclobacillus pomorum]|jgi:hypothetical protein|nr:hypothetical protein [Alicyclobacillus pomorum]